jgi:hypothetical protein
MRSGEAFWIYCDGATTYQGPLRVETKTRLGLVLGQDADSVTLWNDSPNPIQPTVEHVVAAGATLPLSLVIQVTSATNTLAGSVSVAQPAGAWTQPLPPLEAGGAVRVPLEARQQDLGAAFQGSLLKITTDLGTEHWVPIVSLRQDLEEQ